jgi:hypothetical protein
MMQYLPSFFLGKITASNLAKSFRMAIIGLFDHDAYFFNQP